MIDSVGKQLRKGDVLKNDSGDTAEVLEVRENNCVLKKDNRKFEMGRDFMQVTSWVRQS